MTAFGAHTLSQSQSPKTESKKNDNQSAVKRKKNKPEPDGLRRLGAAGDEAERQELQVGCRPAERA